MSICQIVGNFLLRYNRHLLFSSIINLSFLSLSFSFFSSPHSSFSQFLILFVLSPLSLQPPTMCGGAIISDYVEPNPVVVDNLLWPDLDTTFSDLLGLDLITQTQNYPFNNTTSPNVVDNNIPKQLSQGTLL